MISIFAFMTFLKMNVRPAALCVVVILWPDIVICLLIVKQDWSHNILLMASDLSCVYPREDKMDGGQQWQV